MAIPADCPTVLIVAIIADAVPSLSWLTAPMIELLFGVSKRLPPIPIINSRRTISNQVDSLFRSRSKKMPRATIPNPSGHNNLAPILSDSQPLIGDITVMLSGMVISNSPALAAE